VEAVVTAALVVGILAALIVVWLRRQPRTDDAPVDENYCPGRGRTHPRCEVPYLPHDPHSCEAVHLGCEFQDTPHPAATCDWLHQDFFPMLTADIERIDRELRRHRTPPIGRGDFGFEPEIGLGPDLGRSRANAAKVAANGGARCRGCGGLVYVGDHGECT
jgi:hypothetical protein